MEGLELRMRTGRFDGDVGSLICLDWLLCWGDRFLLMSLDVCV